MFNSKSKTARLYWFIFQKYWKPKPKDHKSFGFGFQYFLLSIWPLITAQCHFYILALTFNHSYLETSSYSLETSIVRFYIPSSVHHSPLSHYPWSNNCLHFLSSFFFFAMIQSMRFIVPLVQWLCLIFELQREDSFTYQICSSSL